MKMPKSMSPSAGDGARAGTKPPIPAMRKKIPMIVAVVLRRGLLFFL